MKRYLTIGIIILAIITVYNIMALYTGFYINFNINEEANNNVYANEGKIYVNGNEFKIKGVELTSFYPGYNFSDYKVSKETYKKWIQQIGDMGANTIKVNNRLNPQFYDALYEYNVNNKSPLYLIQCIEIEEYDANNSESIYGFKDKIMKECINAIDAIHGNRYIVTSGISSSGLYTKDISEWTIGYIITNIGKEETIAYTDNTDKRICDQGYNGKYFYTNPNEASETECIIAELMDKMTKYETEKYKEQKLLSVAVHLLSDLFVYKENVNIQLGKVAYININNIHTRETLKTGKFISYNLNDKNNEFIDILSEQEAIKYKDIIDIVDKQTVYGGYVDFINKYYDSPVLISSYSFSTSRMMQKENEEPLTEQEQGQNYVEYYNKFIELGSCGGVISSWQDNWALTTWNVKYSTIEENEIYWFNRQSVDQCNGLLAFESKDREDICYVDGNINEWTEESFIGEQNGVKLYLKYDLENVYIMAKNIEQDKLNIPIDITPNSGSNSYENINFDKNVDFIIKIDGKENSSIVVNEYYDSLRAMYEDNITGLKQYSSIPDKNTSNFSKIRGILKKPIDPFINISRMTPEKRIQYRMYKTTNTGKLKHGINNPTNSEYDSLADYCFGEKNIEIQIPWEILNFSSPNEMLIHDDYYKNYGVEDIKIEELYIGIGDNTQNDIKLQKAKLEPWNRKVEVRERLKKSYEIIKQSWNKEF